MTSQLTFPYSFTSNIITESLISLAPANSHIDYQNKLKKFTGTFNNYKTEKEEHYFI